MIPFIIALSGIIYLILNKSINKSKINPKIKFDFDYSNQLFTEIDDDLYSMLKSYFLENATLISNNEKIGKAFQEYLLNKL